MSGDGGVEVAQPGEGPPLADQVAGSEQRLRLLVDSVSEYAIFMLDPDGRVASWNRGAQRLKGYRAEEIVGRHFSAFYPPGDVEAGKPAWELAQAAAAGQVVDEGWRVRKDGSRFWANVTVTALRGDRGELVGFAKVTRDMTDRREVEQKLLDANTELVRADAAKNEFLSRMSHELRTPLNAILGFAQLLEMDDPRPDQRDNVEQILRAGRHLLDLINEVLDISRIEAGRLPLSMEPVNLAEALREAIGLLRPLAAARRIHLPDTPPRSAAGVHALADRQRLKQVLLNLVSNAIKYNHDGGTITIACSPGTGGRVRVSVRDTGPGIPGDQLHLLFSPFERLGAEGSHVEGTGLGLALANRLVEAMGGSMGVESRPGQGSTFHFELAAAEAVTAFPEPADIAPPPAGAEARTVLYVEDNISNLKLVERILARRPAVTLMTAMQGSLGIDLARQHRPDLVLLDLNLPDIPGDVVLRRLAADPVTAAIPVVVVSADATPGQVARLEGMGAVGYLTKPFDLPTLLATVDDHAGSHPGPSGGGPSLAPAAGPAEPAGDTTLDPATIEQLRSIDDGSSGRVGEAVQVFIDNAGRLVADMHAAGTDGTAISRAAHSLRGSSASFGARRLPALCARLEGALGAGEAAGAGELVAEIDGEVVRVSRALRSAFGIG